MAEVTFDKINVGYTIGYYFFNSESICSSTPPLGGQMQSWSQLSAKELSKHCLQLLTFKLLSSALAIGLLKASSPPSKIVLKILHLACKDLLTDEQCQNILKEIQDERAKTKTDSESVVEAEK